jgi:DHA1 family tetracycline resistance protein-like MFS transporter
VLYTGYRYHWSSAQVGGSLAIVGVMAAIVQGGFARRISPALGERRAIVVGRSNMIVVMSAYGLAAQAWVVYLVLVLGSLCGFAMPAIQGMISRCVPLNEQGAMQGSLASLSSVAGIISPPLMTSLFGYFISPQAPTQLPGASFFLGSVLVFAALMLALRSFQKTQRPVQDASPDMGASAGVQAV